MAKQKKYHFIYKTTCSITNKFYVGMHSTDNLEDGYLGSGKVLGYSLKKYGRENHKLEILEHCHSRDELKRREADIVNEELLSHPLNINLKYGGDGGQTSIVAIQNWSRPGHREKVSASLKETLSTPSIKEAARRKAKELNYYELNLRRAKSFGFAGKKHSPETIMKMKSSSVGKHEGEKNSQFGSKWVNNGEKAVKIKGTELAAYLNMGYKQGRKI